MTARWSTLSRALALCLVLLGVSPFTAPFSTCSLTAPEDEHGLPFEGSIHTSPFAKLDAASDISAALAAGATASPPSFNVVRINLIPAFERDDHRQILRAVLRV
jgi:hypothetical protein